MSNDIKRGFVGHGTDCEIISITAMYLTTISGVMLDATWLQWFHDRGWAIVTATRDDVPWYRNWTCTHQTTFRKIV